ncbi:MAG: hypothetical protein R3B84_16170 [Zavarzinella sp.]
MRKYSFSWKLFAFVFVVIYIFSLSMPVVSEGVAEKCGYASIIGGTRYQLNLISTDPTVNHDLTIALGFYLALFAVISFPFAWFASAMIAVLLHHFSTIRPKTIAQTKLF